MIQERYRADYDGEFVVIDTVWKRNQKLQNREYIKNPITNQHISGRAAVIGQDPTGREDVIRILENHRGGLLGQKKLQTYGCEGIWKKIRVDFCVEQNVDDLQQIVEQKQNVNTVFYSSVRNCLKFPGEFYIIPYLVRLRPCAQSAYLAAFDGHKEVFLIGVDGINNDTVYDPQSIVDLNQVFKAYPGVKFYFVTDASYPDNSLRNNANVDVWSYAKFINHCDV